MANRNAVVQAINDILAVAMSDELEDEVGTDEDVSLDFASAMEVVYELFAVEPMFVARVVVNLNTELAAMDPQRRCMVTQAVGQIISHAGSNHGPSLVESH
eukprot:CAMPEP_0169156120 /NCGR_PEP_ID=MMETSP1015-20121227/53795_1 /TAXON_ID=342587 /ORGANISM="Karlodinium micrum, Strain CCMP2283" /LENGTH=100 /DNA_ID=CAMNT_0009226795 /DNA_START=96 /DNA_END=395 /DNA_ORIENTATION=-